LIANKFGMYSNTITFNFWSVQLITITLSLLPTASMLPNFMCKQAKNWRSKISTIFIAWKDINTNALVDVVFMLLQPTILMVTSSFTIVLMLCFMCKQGSSLKNIGANFTVCKLSPSTPWLMSFKANAIFVAKSNLMMFSMELHFGEIFSFRSSGLTAVLMMLFSCANKHQVEKIKWFMQCLQI